MRPPEHTAIKIYEQLDWPAAIPLNPYETTIIDSNGFLFWEGVSIPTDDEVDLAAAYEAGYRPALDFHDSLSSRLRQTCEVDDAGPEDWQEPEVYVRTKNDLWGAVTFTFVAKEAPEGRGVELVADLPTDADLQSAVRELAKGVAARYGVGFSIYDVGVPNASLTGYYNLTLIAKEKDALALTNAAASCWVHVCRNDVLKRACL
jgi:hypothetical protein